MEKYPKFFSGLIIVGMLAVILVISLAIIKQNSGQTSQKQIVSEQEKVNPQSINNTTFMEQVIICSDVKKSQRGVHIVCIDGFKFVITMHPGHVTTEQILNETGGGRPCGEEKVLP